MLWGLCLALTHIAAFVGGMYLCFALLQRRWPFQARSVIGAAVRPISQESIDNLIQASMVNPYFTRETAEKAPKDLRDLPVGTTKKFDFSEVAGPPQAEFEKTVESLLTNAGTGQGFRG